MGNIQNIDIGVCSVNFNGRDLGHTLDGVAFKYEPMTEDLNVDQYGKTVVDKAQTGEKLTVEVGLAEITVRNFADAVPFGSYASGAQGEHVHIGANAGGLYSTKAGILILHPIRNGASDTSEDITIHKAVMTADFELAYKVDEQRVIPCTFEALLDESKNTGQKLARYGKATIS